MKVFWDAAELAHHPRFFLLRGQMQPNYEVPARAAALLAACESMALTVIAPPAVTMDALHAVHDPAYLDFLRNGSAEWAALANRGEEIVANVHPTPEMLATGGSVPTHVVGKAGWYTADAACPIGAATWASAQAAAATAVAAAKEAAHGRTAYALARPPGHHAYRGRAGGHCYLNNAAVAVEQLRALGANRVAVLDIDSHHGNGTQGVFWNRSDVLFVSVHGDPDNYYPWFVGRAHETGGGDGEGFNLNLPLTIGTGDAGWLDAVEAGVAAIRRFAPDALVLSLGFDASEHEPLNALSVTADGFARAGALIGGLGYPAAIVQEGGYAVPVLGDLLQRFLDGYAP